MRISDVCTREVLATPPGTSLAEAARAMRERHVGCVVVVDDTEERRPVGLVTDRDMVVEVLALGLDYRTMTVGEIASPTMVTANAADDALSTLKLMRRRGVRRLPVVADDGALIGIVSLDDLLQVCGSALDDVVGAITSERSLEAWKRP